MNLVIPMAGRGERFRRAGFSTPKPLIEVHGRPMYAWAAESLPLKRAARLIFVCLEEHASELRRDVERRYAAYSPIVHALPEVTDGQLCTVLEAKDHLLEEQPIVIYNADTYCRGAAASLDAVAPSTAGVIGVFRATGTHWSFARVDAGGRVVETAEKRRISDWATTGLYHFRRAGEFLEHAERYVEEGDPEAGEFYVAPLYNRLIEAGAEVRIAPAEEVWVLGTPRELEAFRRDFDPEP